MYRFFVQENQIFSATHKAVVLGEDVNHIKNVLRMKEGEEISLVVCGDSSEYRCIIKGLSEDSVDCEIIFVKENDVELPSFITLYQALPKSDKMELIIQKAVELGASRIVPVASKRSIVKITSSKEDKKIARWTGISEAAAKQSKRAIVPEIAPVMTFAEAVNDAQKSDVKIIPYELCDSSEMDKTRAIIDAIKPGESVAIFVGPEGGFCEEEIDAAREAGIAPITLGRRILRTETAGFTVLSWLVLKLES